MLIINKRINHSIPLWSNHENACEAKQMELFYHWWLLCVLHQPRWSLPEDMYAHSNSHLVNLLVKLRTPSSWAPPCQ